MPSIRIVPFQSEYAWEPKQPDAIGTQRRMGAIAGLVPQKFALNPYHYVAQAIFGIRGADREVVCAGNDLILFRNIGTFLL